MKARPSNKNQILSSDKTLTSAFRSLELRVPPCSAHPGEHTLGWAVNAQAGFQLEHVFAKSKGNLVFFTIKGKERNSRAEFTCPAALQRGKRMLRPPTFLLPSPGLPPSDLSVQVKPFLP